MNQIPEEIEEHEMTPFESKLAQAILSALEYRGFNDCGKYLDTSLIERIRPLINNFLTEATKKALEEGRLSVLEDFDAMCMADAFVGFTSEEWSAIKKFFEFNKKISGWANSTVTESNAYYCWKAYPYWLHLENGQVIYAERYSHQDGNFSNLCASRFCRCLN